jgi:hypothetical protein
VVILRQLKYIRAKTAIAIGPMEDTTEIAHITNKGPHVNTLGQYHIYREQRRNTVSCNKTFDNFFRGETASGGLGTPHCRGFTITLRHTTFIS